MFAYLSVPIARARNLMNLFTLTIFSVIVSSGAGHAIENQEPVNELFLAGITAELRKGLGISNRVDIVIVDSDARLVSVAPHPDNRKRSNEEKLFTISFDKNFLSMLTAREIRAAIAHELGHVWIFTNHPYLQTEELANRIASRVIDIAELEPVYLKTHLFLADLRNSGIFVPVSAQSGTEEGLSESLSETVK
jgi:hypothetical protein